MLRRAEADAQELDRQQRPDTIVHAQFIRAAVATARGQTADGIKLLQAATARYSAIDMSLCGAFAQQCEAQLAVGASRADLLRQAAHTFTNQAVANPKRYLLAFAPGFS